ncbi:hypothetical protein J3D45_000707 [Microbacterium foliorum]|uniref:hypothetical protein n=1 Tax=Microbacterium foliorum TaxID=104336 RepID=UPI00209F655B|nr:hypothetical protein [Microbacterium foliorum]MCP1428209.1 hypothetical protein [Microbacterium foliorum]
MAGESTVNPDLERYGREQYDSLRPRIHQMRSRALAVAIAPDGMLAREDERTDYSPISYQVRFQLQLAAEHLVALDHLIQGHGLPNYAGYVLIRAALETSATAYWLLQPNVSNRRVLHALRMAFWNQRDSAEFAAAAGHRGTAWDEERRAYLDLLRSKVKGLHQSSLDVPRLSHTDMLTAVGRKLKISQQPSTLLAWRLCSSLAHGNSAAAVMALQHRQINAGEANVHSATSSWALVSALVRTALATFDGALAQFEQRASTA